MTMNNWVYVGSSIGAFVTTQSKIETRTTCTQERERGRERKTRGEERLNLLEDDNPDSKHRKQARGEWQRSQDDCQAQRGLSENREEEEEARRRGGGGTGRDTALTLICLWGQQRSSEQLRPFPLLISHLIPLNSSCWPCTIFTQESAKYSICWDKFCSLFISLIIQL